MQLTAGCGVIHLGELEPPEGRQIVTGVRIHGTRQLSSRGISNVIATYSDNLKLTGTKPLLDRTKLAADARRIESYGAANGYFQARVVDYWVEELNVNRVRVHFRIEEGPPTLVEEISFGDPLADTLRLVGQEDDQEAAQRLEEVTARLQRYAPLRVGHVWRERDYQLGLNRIRDELVRRGFRFARVLGDVIVVREEQRAYVRYHIVPGPLVRLEELRVEGNRRVATKRIMRRVRMKPGKPLTRAALNNTEADIYGLRSFFGVSAEPLTPTLEEKLAGREKTIDNLREIDWPHSVPVRIRVQEMPIHEISVGVGTGIDNTKGEVYLRSGYLNRNFLSGLRHFDISGRPALVSRPNFFDPDQVWAFGARADLLFRQPSLFEEFIELSTRVGYALDVEDGYKSHRVGGSPTLSRRFFNLVTLSVGFNLLYYNYFDFEGVLNLDMTDTLGIEFRDAYLLNELEQVVELDMRDVIYDPRRGGYLALRMSQSFRNIGSDFNYLRFSVDGRIYYSPWSFMTLAVKIQYGQVVDLYGEDVPLPARFRGGGPSDMRGFGAGRMGPYLCETVDPATGERVATSGTGDRCGGRAIYPGGNLHLGASTEVRFHLPANFGLVAFADVGEIWSEREDFALDSLNVAVGPGLRYYTPFGPIRFDFGVQVTPPVPGRFAWHLSIGQAF